MPIRIPNDLPAASALRSENIFVMTDTRAKTQDIRPLKILLLNLMPTKIATETQLARLLGNTPIQVELELLMVKSHVAKNTSEEHMLAFYKTFDQVCDKTYDGMVITGAPVERMAFEDVLTFREDVYDLLRQHTPPKQRQENGLPWAISEDVRKGKYVAQGMPKLIENYLRKQLRIPAHYIESMKHIQYLPRKGDCVGRWMMEN